MKLVFIPNNPNGEKIASMACSCRCKNIYSSAPGMKIPHRR